MASTKATDTKTTKTKQAPKQATKTTAKVKGKEKFKNCFANKPKPEFDIVYEGDIIAKAKPMTARMRAQVYDRAVTTDGEVSPFLLQFYTVLHSLISWELDEEINADNLDMLTQSKDGMDIYVEMHKQITENDRAISALMADNSKN